MRTWPITLLLAIAAPASAQTVPRVVPLGANLERFAYPYPVRWFVTRSQGAEVRMAYMDIAPAGTANGRTLVLLHGKNFCAATWGETAAALAAKGYRVIVPDQIGFCKSSKPAGYQYSFHALAMLTRNLLDQAGAGKVALIGHSTGGILAVRFALLYPEQVARVVLVNPLGLNDTLAEGVPYVDVAALRAEEAKTDAATIKAYQLRAYYGGEWRPAYDRWVAMLAGQYASPDGATVREAQARLSDMIATQPVAAELGMVKAPMTLIIGQRDRSAFRANSAVPGTHVRNVPEAAEAVAARLPAVRLVRMMGLGHSPQVEDPAAFQATLLNELDR